MASHERLITMLSIISPLKKGRPRPRRWQARRPGLSVLPEDMYARTRENGGTILYSAPEIVGAALSMRDNSARLLSDICGVLRSRHTWKCVRSISPGHSS